LKILKRHLKRKENIIIMGDKMTEEKPITGYAIFTRVNKRVKFKFLAFERTLKDVEEHYNLHIWHMFWGKRKKQDKYSGFNKSVKKGFAMLKPVKLVTK